MNAPNSPDTSRPHIRHAIPDRLFHWVMAATVITLGVTAFLPILGIKFDWVPTHWISGVVLGFAILFHLWRVFGVHGITGMMPARSDITMIRRELLMQRIPDLESGKFDVIQKLYHWAAAVIVLALVITGFIMLAKIDTPIWNRDPSILSDWNWGIVYTVHGAASLFLLFLFILHLYFAFLPEHRKFLKAMIFGPGPETAHQPTKGDRT